MGMVRMGTPSLWSRLCCFLGHGALLSLEV